MTNYASRYMESEARASPEDLERLRRIFTLPIDEAVELVDNHLHDIEDLGRVN